MIGVCFLIHRHRDEVLSTMLHCCVVDCIVVGCQSSVRDLFFKTQASGRGVVAHATHVCGILYCGGVPI